MGTFSIWHWLIVLLVTSIPIVVVAFSRGSLTRKGYVVRFVVSVLVAVVIAMIAEEGIPLLYVPVAIISLFITRWIAMRLNGVEWSRWWAVSWVIFWPVGLVLAIVLCIKRGPIDIREEVHSEAERISSGP